MRLRVSGVAVVMIEVACSSSSSAPPPLSGPDGGAGGDATVIDGATIETGPGVDGQPPSDGPKSDASPPPTNDVSDQYTSGSRLQARWYVTTDGFQKFLGWRDSQLNLDCSFSTAGDGQLRCLPAPELSLYANNFDFADAACTQPLALFSPYGACTTVPAIIQRFDTTVCPARTRVYALGASASANHYALQNGMCMPTMGGAMGTYYSLGPELSPGMYASGAFQSGAPSGGLVPVSIAGADGSSGFDHWTEASGGAVCYFAQAADMKYRCLPETPAFNTGDFTDGTCTVKAFGAQQNACPNPAIAASYDQGCPQLEHIFALGAPTSSLYYSSAGMCVSTPLWAGYRFFALGGETPPSTFPEVTLAATAAGAGRLKETDFVTMGGLLEANGIVDTLRSSESCYPNVAADGQIRCLPPTMFSGYFADMACTQPLAGWISSICGPVPKYAGSVDTTTCPGHSHVYNLGAAVAPATVYFQSGTMCINVGMPAINFYSIGAEVPASSFQALSALLR